MASRPLSRFLVTAVFSLSLFAVPPAPRSPEPRALPSFTQTLLTWILDGRDHPRHRPAQTKEGIGIDPTGGGTPKPPCSGVCP